VSLLVVHWLCSGWGCCLEGVLDAVVRAASRAIQLAVAARYDVVTTAAPHNHDRARRRSVRHVFDYVSPGVVRGGLAALRRIPVAGVLAVGTGSAEPILAIAIAAGVARVCLASPSVSLEALPRRSGISVELLQVARRQVVANLTLQVRARRHQIRARFVWGSTLMNSEVGPTLWEHYLPAATSPLRSLRVATSQPPSPSSSVTASHR